MHFGDERYVRLYTRDTLTWLSLGWEGQAALALLMRKVDRAGVLEIDDRTAEESIAAVTGLPQVVCDVAWPRLSAGKDPTVTLRDETSRALVILRFVEAQEAIATDKARARKARETRRAVTRRDDTSQGVTNRHARSRGVTPSRTVLCRTEEDLGSERIADPAARPPEPLQALQPRLDANGGDAVDAWPSDLVEQMRGPLKRQIPACDNGYSDFLRESGRQYPAVQRRVNAGLVLLERAADGSTFGFGYVWKLLAEGAEPRRARVVNGERQWTDEEKESFRRRNQPPAIPERPETSDEINARKLAEAEERIRARKGGGT